MRGTTLERAGISLEEYISTHVPHAGHDRAAQGSSAGRPHFNSRAPCGARRVSGVINSCLGGFQLTCPMRGTTNTAGDRVPRITISTHVPHAGHDRHGRLRDPRITISTHVPHAGHDLFSAITEDNARNFNSRAPCGARPHTAKKKTRNSRFQLTCPMRGTTHVAYTEYVNACISTHVPHAGHDGRDIIWFANHTISTHVPHAGHDAFFTLYIDDDLHFNSRAPCGARPLRTMIPERSFGRFQLTCPMRGTTAYVGSLLC